MIESEVTQILKSLVEPYRNASSSLIPETVIGWRFGNTVDAVICDWTGIICDDDATIIGLDLEDGIWIESLLGYVTPIAKSYANKHQTHRLLLEETDDALIPSSIGPFLPPSLGKLTSLKIIKFSSNWIQGTIPKEITKLPNLEIFEVRSNHLTGTFPHLYSEKIQVFDISKNHFSGTFPQDLFAHPSHGPGTAPFLQSLIKFDVSHNSFSGTIPLNGKSAHEMALKNLKFFDVGFNSFSGTIPNNFGTLESLTELFLEHNKLVGTIPKSLYRGSGIGSNPLPLEQLYLQQNDLSGTLPSGLGQLPNLKELYVDGNKLTGDIPDELCRKELNDAFLNDTEAASRCDGISCPANSKSNEGVAPCMFCPDDGGFNRYLGRHGNECKKPMNEVEILDRFFERLHGEYWLDPSYMWERGSAVCQRKGVGCDKAGNAVSITLSGLGLRGSLPTELGALTSLQVFNVSHNYLTGFLPSDFRFTNITSFDVSGNSLSGHVPIMMCIKDGINNNGIGPPEVDLELLYSCDNIVCSRGSYSSIGRASVADSITCLPCFDDLSIYLGRNECTDFQMFGHQIRRDDALAKVKKAVPYIAIILGAFFILKRLRRKTHLIHFDSSQLSSTRNLALRQFSSTSFDDFEDDAEEYYSDDDWTAAASEGDTHKLGFSRKKSEMVVLRGLS